MEYLLKVVKTDDPWDRNRPWRLVFINFSSGKKVKKNFGTEERARNAMKLVEEEIAKGGKALSLVFKNMKTGK